MKRGEGLVEKNYKIMEGIEMEKANICQERVLVDGKEKQLLTQLYQRGHLLADFVAEQLFGPLMELEDREEVIRAAFGALASRVEELENLTMEEQMKRMCIAVRDAALAENRRRLRRDLTRGRKQRSPEKRKVSRGRMMPGVSEMVEGVVRDEWYLYVALRRMETREFTLLIEKYQNRLSDREIGEKMGIKTRNVRVYMARARRKVTMYYQEEEANGERDEE